MTTLALRLSTRVAIHSQNVIDVIRLILFHFHPSFAPGFPQHRLLAHVLAPNVFCRDSEGKTPMSYAIRDDKCM